MIGKTISHYRIVEEIGSGGMGIVYKAEDTRLKRFVALKFLPPHHVENEMEKMRFTREAQAAASLEHPNICSVHEIDEAEGLTFISMAYCEGRTLEQIVADGRLTVSDALDIAIQIAAGLSQAHAKGIIHRDIKPANIMVSDKNQVKIMDFGLAKLSNLSRVTSTGAALGTISYMSPEQMQGETVDGRSDIWSLGVALYELLTGRHPFLREYQAATIYSILKDEPIPITELDPAIPPELARIVARALQKKREQRYASIDAMFDDLNRAKRLQEHLTIPPGSVTRGSRGHHMRKSAVVTSGIVAFFIIIYALLSIPTSRRDTWPISLAVVDFDNKTDNSDFACLTDLLITDLKQCPHIIVVSRSRLEELCRSSGAGSLDDSTAFAVAGMEGIQTLAFPRIIQIGDTYRINASVYSVATRKLIFDKAVQGKGDDGIFDMIDDLFTQLRAELKDLTIIPHREHNRYMPLKELVTGSMAAYRMYAKGESLYNTGNQLEAIPYIEGAVEIDSTFVQALRVLALLYDYMGDNERALHCATKAKNLSRERDERELIKSMITERIVLENWDQAIEYMKLLLEFDPNDVVQHLSIGFYLSTYKKAYGEAIEHFERALALDEKNLSGRHGQLFNSLGYACLFSGRPEKAMEWLMRYKESSPDSPDPLHSIAFAYLYTGRHREAAELLNEVIQRHPHFYIAYEHLGLIRFSCGNWNEAISCFGRYIQYAPYGSRPAGHVHIAYVHFVQDNVPQAKQEIAAALSIDPTYSQAHLLQGLISLATYEGTERARESLAAIEESTSLAEHSLSSACYHSLRGWILLSEGEKEQGLRSLQLAAEAAPSMFFSFDRDLVRGYVTAGSFEEAIREGERILSISNNDAEVLCLLGQAFEMTNQQEKSEYYRARALDVWRNADPHFCPLEKLKSRSSTFL